MKPKLRRNLSGAFAAQETGKGMWRLARREPPRIDVYLKGAEPDAIDVLKGGALSDINIEWDHEAAVLNVNCRAGTRAVRTQSALVHEFLPRLYEVLPLATFDDKARRFWRRVFILVRIPGGRHVLAALARRSR
ncbi:MAG: hypothetical protein M3N50_08625 [Pseudomonadota bacterium]|nr:hypothetical protein [Pseudomonadota bacterium]